MFPTPTSSTPDFFSSIELKKDQEILIQQKMARGHGISTHKVDHWKKYRCSRKVDHFFFKVGNLNSNPKNLVGAFGMIYFIDFQDFVCFFPFPPPPQKKNMWRKFDNETPSWEVGTFCSFFFHPGGKRWTQISTATCCRYKAGTNPEKLECGINFTESQKNLPFCEMFFWVVGV